MSNFIPYPFFHDDVPIDISFMFEDEKPAGKHGFLKVSGKDLAFEDGSKVKFWGTNFNGWGCFPEHDYAKKLARRLAKMGINLVRFHQLDSEWHTPNIFAFTKGKRRTDAHLDPESMDRLDYLIYCLKEEGIYCYMDMFTYRKFKSDEGVENAIALKDAAKSSSVFSRKLIDLQKELCRELWQHKNPYSKLSYADDPVFVMAEITNECELFSRNQWPLPEPYFTEFKDKFDKWLAEKNIDKKADDFDYTEFDNETLIDFKICLQEKYYKEMYACMRECGVKIPITGTNWSSCPANLKTQFVTDFNDNHCYFYDWRWGEFEKRFTRKSITRANPNCVTSSGKDLNPAYQFLFECAVSGVKDRPTFISEWDMPWPAPYRAESPIYAAAYGLLQGWSGFAIHTYSYSPRLDRMNTLGQEIFSEKIGGVPYRQGIFSAWNDPAKFGLFYHAAIMTRRGDVARAKNAVEIDPISKFEFNNDAIYHTMEKSEINCNYDLKKFAEKTETDMEPVIKSDTGELMIDRGNNYGTVNTDMTKCAYGFLGKNGKIELSGVSIQCETDFATIALSSLDENRITKSDNILLTAVGRAENTDMKTAGDAMLDIGKPPVCVEVIKAEIEIETEIKDFNVWAISPEGFYIGTVPTSYEDGKLKFTVGNTSQSMYYLIVKE